VPEPPALRGGELAVAFERVGAPPHEVLEVGEAPLALRLLVALVGLGHRGERPRRVAAGGFGRDRVRLRPQQLGLGPLDLARDLRRRQRRLGPAPTHDRDEEPDLALDHLGRGAALVERTAAQLRERDGVDGARGEGRVDAEPAQAVLQLARGLAGERDREHVGRVVEALAGPPRDAPGEHARLPRSRGRVDRQRDGRRGDGLALLGVEVVEQRVAGGNGCGFGGGGSGHCGDRTERV